MKKTCLKITSIMLLMVMMLMVAACNAKERKQKFTKTCFEYFDTVTTIIGYAENEEEFLSVSEFVCNELSIYHKLYDIYNLYDGITNLALINKTYNDGHKSYTVDREIMDLLLYAKKIYKMTEGETNIAMGSVLSIWHDYRERGNKDPTNATLPDEEILRSASKHTDINNLILDEENMSVFISDPEMKLDVGAFAKGYAVEMTARKLEAKGISGYTINVGGNIRAIGSKPNGDLWKIGIENPDTDIDEPYIEYLQIEGKSVVTSGSYHRFYSVDGVNYHHIIDKDTLYPSAYFSSVSVVCSDSGLADALSTAMFSMPYEDGLALAESLDDVQVLWCMKDGTLKMTSGMEKYREQ